jgi:calcium-dependent protein kinase
MYIMLSGSPPFNAKTDKAIYQKILDGKVNFPNSKWDKVSEEAKNLILKMLEYDPAKRISARHALIHPWILSTPK